MVELACWWKVKLQTTWPAGGLKMTGKDSADRHIVRRQDIVLGQRDWERDEEKNGEYTASRRGQKLNLKNSPP